MTQDASWRQTCYSVGWHLNLDDQHRELLDETSRTPRQTLDAPRIADSSRTGGGALAAAADGNLPILEDSGYDERFASTWLRCTEFLPTIGIRSLRACPN